MIVIAAGSFAPLLAMLNGARIGGLLRASANRMFDLIERPGSVSETGTHLFHDLHAPEIGFHAVSFTYPGSSTEVLHAVDLTIEAGETIAFVGPTGAGKTTLAHLLLRYFEPTSGRITVDGIDVADMACGELARVSSHVSQDVFLFHDTLAANLRIGTPEATQRDLLSSCEEAQVLPILERLDGGIETVVGERGSRLSGGERQRVAIARALLRRTPILVLDESASQIDVLAEREIQSALEAARLGRTTVVIAHRLSTILAADRIAVIDKGRVVAVGRHEGLLESCELYATLIHTQEDALALLEAAGQMSMGAQPSSFVANPTHQERRPS